MKLTLNLITPIAVLILVIVLMYMQMSRKKTEGFVPMMSSLYDTPETIDELMTPSIEYMFFKPE